VATYKGVLGFKNYILAESDKNCHLSLQRTAGLD
jgi:hypothetical protein